MVSAGPAAFFSACLAMMRSGDRPRARAARMYSLSSTSTSPVRTCRASSAAGNTARVITGKTRCLAHSVSESPGDT